jgi:hypothetical protein
MGTPSLLVVFAGWPWHRLEVLMSEAIVQSSTDRLIDAWVLLMWGAWVWMVVATAREFVLFRRGANDTTRASTRLILVFLVSLWSSFFSRSSFGPELPTMDAIEHDEAGRSSVDRRAMTPLALTSSSFAVAFVLRSLSDRREAVVKRMPTDRRLARVGSVERAFWRSLRMSRARLNEMDDVRDEGRIPIGLRDEAPIMVSLEPGDSLGVEARVVDDARAVARHVQWMIESFGVDRGASPVAISVGLADGQRLQIVQDDLGWHLVSTGERFDAFGVTDHEYQLVERLHSAAVATEPRPPLCVGGHWRVLVRVMGPVVVETRDGTIPSFEKSRSIELLAWLVTHRERPTRAAARTAMWEVDVQNATFNNVVSDLRKGLQPFQEEKGRFALEKSFDERLILDETITCDADVLDRSLREFVRDPGDRQRNDLIHSLGLVRDMPFLGTDYLWPDPEGITSNVVHLIVNSSRILAEDALERGDSDTVFWATGQGLKVLRNHEGLIGLRMRAYAQRGDLAGVQHEWDRYESGIGHERNWEELQLVRLRDELLGVAVCD